MKTFSIIRLLRPKQWIKNVFVFPALLFSGDFLKILNGFVVDINFNKLITVGLLFVMFSLVSSCIYIINDIKDIEEDKIHPKKQYRPLASGKVSIKQALIILGILFTICVGFSFYFNIKTTVVIIIYIVINILYTFWLKRKPIIEILCVASGFLFRAVAGAVVIDLTITNWFLLSIFMISFMIATVKRRGEFAIEEESRRHVVKLYNKEILNIFVGMSSISAMITYCIFAINHELEYLYISIPFVIYALMRYLYKSYTNEKLSGSPDELLTSDIHIIVTGFLYVVSVILAMFVLQPK